MQGIATLEAYLSHPVGRYLLGPTFVHWWCNPRLNGITFWGRPEEEHIRVVIGALGAEFRADVAPHWSLIDVRRVSVVDLAAFTALLHFARAHRDALGAVVRGQAFLRPDGLAGAAVAGFPAVLDPAYPTRVFTDPTEALRWLEVADVTATLRELDEIYARTSGETAFLAGIRAFLERTPGSPTLHDTARAFAMSARNLQRRLSEMHTTFQAEQNAARVRVATTLLLETNYGLKRIAIEVGCASLQNFSALFHKSVGESPSQWRARQRPSDFPSRSLSRSPASHG